MRSREPSHAGLRSKIEYWSVRLRVRPRILRVQRMTRKWGSCSTAGVITLAVDLAKQDRAFQDYVIVHELLHLKVPNHGKVFKALMRLHLPGWRQQKTRGAEGVTRFVLRA